MAKELKAVDPTEAWEPATGDGWNLKWAAHLYRRAAFGSPPSKVFNVGTSWEALRETATRDMESCVEQLLEGGPGEADFARMMDSIGNRFVKSRSDLPKLQGWWLYRMLHTEHPLLERTTLFWHNHFATSAAKVRQLDLMLRQNNLLRSHALGSFRTMLLEIGRDPAMLLWLDSNGNLKGHPNENYAREVMELFSLGEGNYTERDIQEAARAFTGWGTSKGQFVFRPDQHDDGPKTVLGKTGNWNGDDIVQILLDQPAAARFLAHKLYRQFISESDDPPENLIEPLAELLRKSDYDIKLCIGTILRSRMFYSDYAYRQRIKSPVDYVVGLLKTFDARPPMDSLAGAMKGLGQSLFAPPNVKGWDGGRTWLNSASLLARHNLSWQLLGGGDEPFEDALDPHALVDRVGKKTLAQQVQFLVDLLLDGSVPEKSRQKLVDFGTQQETEAKIPPSDLLRELTHTILLMPEFQLA